MSDENIIDRVLSRYSLNPLLPSFFFFSSQSEQISKLTVAASDRWPDEIYLHMCVPAANYRARAKA